MASTAREALIAELLGDVGRLHDEVQALRQALPELTRATTAQLDVHTAQLLAAAARLEALIAALGREIDQQVATAAHAATEAAQAGIRAMAAEAAAESVKRALDAELRPALAALVGASERLDQDTAQAARQVRAAAREVGGHRAGLVALVIAGGLLGGLAVLAGLVAAGLL